MNDGKIRIKKIKLADLYDFACEIPANSSFREVAPISLIRAMSQSKNPSGRPEDVVLFVAFSGNQCVGYHGLLPTIFNHGDDYSRVHWATTFFVAPDFRGQGIGKCLLEKIKNAKIDFIVTQMTESAERAYRSAGYKDIGRLNYFQLRVDRLDFLAGFLDAIITYLTKKTPCPKAIHIGLTRVNRLIYRITKIIFYRRVLRNNYRRPRRMFTWKVVDQINESLWGSLDRHRIGPGFFRGVAAVTWMLKYPWVVSSSARKADVPNYYFSGVRDIFRYIAIEINSPEEGLPKGFMVLSVSDKKEKTRVKILDFYFNNPTDCEIAVYLALRYAKVFLADRIDYPASFENYFKKTTGFKKLIKKQSHLYMFYPASNHSPLAVYNGKIVFNYCDGDTAFT